MTRINVTRRPYPSCQRPDGIDFYLDPSWLKAAEVDWLSGLRRSALLFTAHSKGICCNLAAGVPAQHIVQMVFQTRFSSCIALTGVVASYKNFLDSLSVVSEQQLDLPRARWQEELCR